MASQNDSASLLALDQLEVAFDAKKRKACSEIQLVIGWVCFATIAISLVVFSLTAESSDGLKKPLIYFGVVCLVVFGGCMALKSNTHLMTITQACTITSTHIISRQRGFRRVEQNIPLKNVRDVIVRGHSLMINTGMTRMVGSVGDPSPYLGNRRSEVDPELVLHGVKSATQVREFMMAKQQALWQNQRQQYPQGQNQHQVAIAIARPVEAQHQVSSTPVVLVCEQSTHLS